VRFLRFSRKRQDGSASKFFSGFRRKHLFITACNEKHCTQPLEHFQMADFIDRRSRISDYIANQNGIFVDIKSYVVILLFCIAKSVLLDVALPEDNFYCKNNRCILITGNFL